MTSRVEREALRDYVSALRDAIGCVTPLPLATEVATENAGDRTFSITLHDLDPTPLPGRSAVSLAAGQHVRIASTLTTSVRVVKYFYTLTTADDREILTFQWTPEATEGKTFPHLHVGRAIVSDKTLVMPDRFHKVHVPTGHVTFAAVIRLAIEEFRVKPLVRRWQDALARADDAERDAHRRDEAPPYICPESGANTRANTGLWKSRARASM